jgi:hypothetical protein
LVGAVLGIRNPTPKGVVGFVITCAVTPVIYGRDFLTCGFTIQRDLRDLRVISVRAETGVIF